MTNVNAIKIVSILVIILDPGGFDEMTHDVEMLLCNIFKFVQSIPIELFLLYVILETKIRLHGRIQHK